MGVFYVRPSTVKQILEQSKANRSLKARLGNDVDPFPSDLSYIRSVTNGERSPYLQSLAHHRTMANLNRIATTSQVLNQLDHDKVLRVTSF